MSRIILGTVQFGMTYGIANQIGQASLLQVKSMLDFALENGIDTLDTAIAYGDSEKSLGEACVQSFNVVTKLPLVPDDCGDVRAWVFQQVDASLLRLGLSEIYGLLLHRPDQLLGPNGKTIYRVLQELKGKGKVKKIGISIYSPSELAALIPSFRFDLVQAPFNLIDRRVYKTGWAQRLKDEGIEIHTRSTFLQGLLLMGRDEVPSKFLRWNALWDQWHCWLADYNGPAAQACLEFSLSFPEIDGVIVGVDSKIQLRQIMMANNYPSKIDLPRIECCDENLINPANWSQL